MIKARRNYKNSVKKGMKRYVARKKRVSRYSLTGDVTYVKCEDYGQLYVDNANPYIKWSDSGEPWYNVATMLANSLSFTQQVPIYGRYKITGLSVRCAPANASSVISSKFTSSFGFPCYAVAFYPNSTSTDLGTVTLFNDRKLILDPCSTSPVSRYWKTPDGFYTQGGVGFGIWSQSLNYTAQVGSLLIRPSLSTNVLPLGPTSLFNYVVTVYVTFSDKNV